MKTCLVCSICFHNKSYDTLSKRSYCFSCGSKTFNLIMSLQQFDSLLRENKINNIITPKMKILVAKEKHITRYLMANTDDELEKSCRKLLSERLGYYDGEFYDQAKEELSNPSGRSYKFIKLRSNQGHEYEGIEIVTIEDYH